jgi:hypothetical protein
MSNKPRTAMADEATMKALRQLEAELDAHYQTLPLFRRPLGNAIYALLAAFDSLYLIEPSLTPNNQFNVDVMQLRRSFEEGLAQSLRWLLGKTADVDPIPSNDPVVVEQAFYFFEFAGKYNQIEAFHQMLAKKWVDVAVDLEQEQVHFKPVADPNARRTMAGYEEGFGNQQIPRSIRGDFSAAFDAAQSHLDALKHEMRDGRVVLLDLAEVNHPSIVALENLGSSPKRVGNFGEEQKMNIPRATSKRP